jgi:hypothetical protein
MSSRRKPAGQRTAKADNKKDPIPKAKENAGSLSGGGPEIHELKNFVTDQMKRQRQDVDQNYAVLTKDLETTTTKLRKRAKVGLRFCHEFPSASYVEANAR